MKSLRHIGEAITAHRAHGHRWAGEHIESLLFSRPEWTMDRAQEWAKAHGYRYSDVDLKPRYIHLRQRRPINGKQKRTIDFGKGIRAVIEQE
jgi:hypothetical protein